MSDISRRQQLLHIYQSINALTLFLAQSTQPCSENSTTGAQQQAMEAMLLNWLGS
jgi:hypothetical protein